MDTALKISILLVSAIGFGLTLQFLVRWLTYHRQAARLKGNALSWRKEVEQLPEYQAMRQSRLLFFATFFGTLGLVNGLVTLLPLLQN